MFARATRSGLGVQIGLCSAGMSVGLGVGFTTEARRPQKEATKKRLFSVYLCASVSRW